MFTFRGLGGELHFLSPLRRAKRSSDSLGPPWAGCVSPSPDIDGSLLSYFSYSVVPAKMFKVFAPPLAFYLFLPLSFPSSVFFIHSKVGFLFICLLACSLNNLENDPLTCTRTKAWGSFLWAPRLSLPMLPLSRSSEVFLTPRIICSSPPCRQSWAGTFVFVPLGRWDLESFVLSPKSRWNSIWNVTWNHD